MILFIEKNFCLALCIFYRENLINNYSCVVIYMRKPRGDRERQMTFKASCFSFIVVSSTGQLIYFRSFLN